MVDGLVRLYKKSDRYNLNVYEDKLYILWKKEN